MVRKTGPGRRVYDAIRTASLDGLLRETGPAAVRDHLKQDEESRRKADLNSWQAACHSARRGQRLVLRGRL